MTTPKVKISTQHNARTDTNHWRWAAEVHAEKQIKELEDDIDDKLKDWEQDALKSVVSHIISKLQWNSK